MTCGSQPDRHARTIERGVCHSTGATSETAPAIWRCCSGVIVGSPVVRCPPARSGIPSTVSFFQPPAGTWCEVISWIASAQTAAFGSAGMRFPTGTVGVDAAGAGECPVCWTTYPVPARMPTTAAAASRTGTKGLRLVVVATVRASFSWSAKVSRRRSPSCWSVSLGISVVLLGGQVIAQVREGARDVRSDSPRGGAEDVGDLGVVQILVVPQDQYGALLPRQPGE